MPVKEGVTHIKVEQVGYLDSSVVNALEHIDTDRLFVLKLERNMLICLNSPTITTIRLTTAFKPYHRMLLHRLSDYYGLERIVTVMESDPNEKVEFNYHGKKKEKAVITLVSIKAAEISFYMITVA